MDVVRAQLQELIEQNERELQASMQTSHRDDVMESPCAKKARIGIPPLWSKLSHAEQRPWQPQKSPITNRSTLQIENEMLIAAVASPMRPRRSLGIDGFESPRQPQKSPITNRSTLQIDNEMLIAAVASPMRPRRSLGIDGFESDKVETLVQESFEAKRACAAALSAGAPPPKKPRTQDDCSQRGATPQVMKMTEPTEAGNPSLTGFWSNFCEEHEVVNARISGSIIFFSTGESERLERVAKKKVSLHMDGETHIGFVNDKDNVILWSDGDVWFFVGTSPPPACAEKKCVKKRRATAADSDDDADGEEEKPVAGHDDKANTEARALADSKQEEKPVVGHDDKANTEARALADSKQEEKPVAGHDDKANTEARALADSKQDGEVSAAAIDEWVQAQWMSLTEPTQESNPKVDEKKKDARQKADVIKMQLPLGPLQTMTHTQRTQKKQLSTPASTAKAKAEEEATAKAKAEEEAAAKAKAEEEAADKAKAEEEAAAKAKAEEEAANKAKAEEEAAAKAKAEEEAAIAWTPERRVHLREKIQNLLVEAPTEVRDSCPSSRSSSPRASRSRSPRTLESASVLHGSSSPQKRRDSIVPQPSAAAQQPGRVGDGSDGRLRLPQPGDNKVVEDAVAEDHAKSPPGSPGCDGFCMPPAPPESSPSNQLRAIAIQTEQPCSTTLIRPRCVPSAMHLRKRHPDSIEEIDVEAMNLGGRHQHPQQPEGMEQSLAEATKDGQAEVPTSSGIDSPLPWWWHLVRD